MSVVTEIPKTKAASRPEMIETLREYLELARHERLEFLEIVAQVEGEAEDHHSVVIDGVYSAKV